jgi:inorganic pyrophosphatase
VVSERPINHSEVILDARVVGGLPMNDHGEADDKIIAVLENDPVWHDANDIGDLPEVMVERLRHYFITYKLKPGEKSRVSIDDVYDRDHAHKVILASMADYEEEFGS